MKSCAMMPQDGPPEPSPAEASKMRNASKTWGITTFSEFIGGGVEIQWMCVLNRFRSIREQKSIEIHWFLYHFLKSISTCDDKTIDTTMKNGVSEPIKTR